MSFKKLIKGNTIFCSSWTRIYFVRIVIGKEMTQWFVCVLCVKMCKRLTCWLFVYSLFRMQLPYSMCLRQGKDNIYRTCHYFLWVGNIHLTGEGLNEYHNPLCFETYKFQFQSPFFSYSICSRFSCEPTYIFSGKIIEISNGLEQKSQREG